MQIISLDRLAAVFQVEVVARMEANECLVKKTDPE